MNLGIPYSSYLRDYGFPVAGADSDGQSVHESWNA